MPRNKIEWAMVVAGFVLGYIATWLATEVRWTQSDPEIPEIRVYGVE